MSKIIFLTLFLSSLVFGQIKPPEGLRENSPSVWALKGAKTYIEPGKVKENSTIIIRDGLIENVGINIKIPKDASVLDMTGKTIYPGFIDSWVELPNIKETISHHDSHWNSKVNSRKDMSQLYQADEKNIKSLQKLGFTSAHIVADSGIFQGQTAVIQLDKEGTVLKSNVAQNIAYEVDGWGSKKYPNSLLGVMALIRQTFIDADWYIRSIEQAETYPQFNEPLERNRDLTILGEWVQFKKPFLFETNHELTALRSFNLAKEFKLNCWIKGSGYEYRRIKKLFQPSRLSFYH